MPATLPVFSQPGLLLLPRIHIPLQIQDHDKIALVEDAIGRKSLIGLTQPCAPYGEKPPTTAEPDLCAVGCAGLITDYTRIANNHMIVRLLGICRFEIHREMDGAVPYRLFRVNYAGFADDFTPGHGESRVDRSKLLDLCASYLDLDKTGKDWSEVEKLDSESLVNILAMLFPHEIRDKQALLEAANLALRSEILISLTEKALLREQMGDQIVKQ